MAAFPEIVDVTDQLIDVSGFSSDWKEKVADLGDLIASKYRESGKERYLVAFGGASGTSKSTTAKVLESILRSSGIPAATAGQDGYHFPQEYLLRTLDSEGRPLAEHKGRYDSFDVAAIKTNLERFVEGKNAAFPEYSRKTHNPLPDAIPISGPSLLLFEGLWLLYDRAPWNALLTLYDITVFFRADDATRKRNTIARRVRGHKSSLSEANLFYENSDAKNAELILGSIAKHDLDLSFL
jgi:pantothenate kinase